MVRVQRKQSAVNSSLNMTKNNLDTPFKSPKKKEMKMSKAFHGKLSHASPYACPPRSINTRYFAKFIQVNFLENQVSQSEIKDCQSLTDVIKLESDLCPITIEIPQPGSIIAPVSERTSPRLAVSKELEVESKRVVPKIEFVDLEPEVPESETKSLLQVETDSNSKSTNLEILTENEASPKKNIVHSVTILKTETALYSESVVLTSETEILGTVIKTEIKTTESPNSVVDTPVTDCTKSPQTVISPTPHKIQLRNDNISTALAQSPSSALSFLHISGTPKKAVKTRRRLNPSQTSNQQPASQKAGSATPARPTKKDLAVANNHKLTEYFPIRRSERKTKRTVLEEKQLLLEEAVKTQCEDGLEVRNFEGKGRGVVATRPFFKGDFVVEYSGELIEMNEAKSREHVYTQDQNTGCYMYYFKYKNNQYCIDATKESGRLGRLVNHSRNGNLTTKTVPIAGKPHLVLIAKESIRDGDEVLYDYGDRSKESLLNHPWLNL